MKGQLELPILIIGILVLLVAMGGQTIPFLSAADLLQVGSGTSLSCSGIDPWSCHITVNKPEFTCAANEYSLEVRSTSSGIPASLSVAIRDQEVIEYSRDGVVWEALGYRFDTDGLELPVFKDLCFGMSQYDYTLSLRTLGGEDVSVPVLTPPSAGVPTDTSTPPTSTQGFDNIINKRVYFASLPIIGPFIGAVDYIFNNRISMSYDCEYLFGDDYLNTNAFVYGTQLIGHTSCINKNIISTTSTEIGIKTCLDDIDYCERVGLPIVCSSNGVYTGCSVYLMEDIL